MTYKGNADIHFSNMYKKIPRTDGRRNDNNTTVPSREWTYFGILYRYSHVTWEDEHALIRAWKLKAVVRKPVGKPTKSVG